MIKKCTYWALQKVLYQGLGTRTDVNYVEGGTGLLVGHIDPGDTGALDPVGVPSICWHDVWDRHKKHNQEEYEQVQEKQPSQKDKIGHYACALVTWNIKKSKITEIDWLMDGWMDRWMDWIGFYAVSAIFQLYNGGSDGEVKL